MRTSLRSSVSAMLLAGVTAIAFFGLNVVPERGSDALGQRQLSAARAQARTELDQLRELGGPNYAYADRVEQLGATADAASVARLLAVWQEEEHRMSATRVLLSDASGGLNEGRPADVVGGLNSLRDLTAQAAGEGLNTNDALAAQADAQIYLSQPYPVQLGLHDVVAGELQGARDQLQGRLNLRQRADDLLARLPDLLRQAAGAGVTVDFGPRAAQARRVLGAAIADESALQAAIDTLQKLEDEVGTAATSAAAARAAAAADAASQLPAGPCTPTGAGKTIVIHLATQTLDAQENGCSFLRTTVTTGRAALPTDRGVFSIFYKAPAYKMVSPWGRNSPFWYADTWVYNAMEFVGDGTFIHSAGWQPVDTYGSGSQYGPYASHGCIHVPDGTLATLYAWAPIGTTVVVGD